MKRALLTLQIILAFGISLSAQKYTVSGFVSDASNGEKLLGTNVYNSKTYEGTVTNAYGFYSLTQPAGEVEIKYSFVGYQPVTVKMNLQKDTVINIELQPTIELEEVEIKSNSIAKRLESSQMSVTELSMNTVKKLPVFFGETDIIKTIQLLPGVQSGTEGTSGLYVRGGGPDENLILLDGVPVYNVNHLFGFFSVFNADALNTVTLVKGGFPARYGGRLSSVLDIRMKEGNLKEFHGEGSVGLIASKLTLEGPIVKDKSSFIVSARRTYIDILAYPFMVIYNKANNDGESFYGGYYFYDLNGKVNYKFSEKSRLYLSAYLGNDKAFAKSKYQNTNYLDNEYFKLRWGNITTSLRWNYVFNKKLFANVRGSYTRYKFLIGSEYESKSPKYYEYLNFDYFSGIDDVAGAVDFDYVPVPNHYIRFGFSNIYHTFKPGINAYKYNENEQAQDNISIDTTFGNSNIYANEMDAYLEDDFSLGSRLKLNLGIHASGFYVKNKFYHSFQPRASMRFITNENLSLKVSYAAMSQYIHLLSNTSIGMPTDLWVPVTDTIKPMKSQQVAGGAVYNLNNMFEISLEGYYKWMDNLITYKPGASYLQVDKSWQQMVTTGKGWSYGAELLVRKDAGKLTGWIGYTLSWSWRQFDEVSPVKYPYHYDRRHDISIVATYKVNDKFDFGATWVFGTGYPVTLPYDKYIALDNYKGYLGNTTNNGFPNLPYIDNIKERNNYRTPSYHRLDLGFNFHKKTKWGERTWSVGIYNAYFRQNPFFLYIDYNYEHYNGEGEPKKVLKQVSLFPGIPYVSYNFKF
jgi:hypothetical protein